MKPVLEKQDDFAETQKRAAWEKASLTISAQNRVDCDGRIIRWSEYGMDSDFGWRIDYIVPLSKGGGEELANLRARHWRGSRSPRPASGPAELGSSFGL